MLPKNYVPVVPKLGKQLTAEEYSLLFDRVAAPILANMFGDNAVKMKALKSLFIAVTANENTTLVVGARENDHLWKYKDAHAFSINQWVYSSPRNYHLKNDNLNPDVKSYSGDGFIFRGAGFAQITGRGNVQRTVKVLTDVLDGGVLTKFPVERARISICHSLLKSALASKHLTEETFRACIIEPAYDMALTASYVVMRVKLFPKLGDPLLADWIDSKTISLSQLTKLARIWGYPNVDVRQDRGVSPSYANIAGKAFIQLRKPEKASTPEKVKVLDKLTAAKQAVWGSKKSGKV